MEGEEKVRGEWRGGRLHLKGRDELQWLFLLCARGIFSFGLPMDRLVEMREEEQRHDHVQSNRQWQYAKCHSLCGEQKTEEGEVNTK